MDKIYLNTAASGLIDEATLNQTLEFYNTMQTNASEAAEHFKFNGGLQRVREAVADFINAPVQSVAFLPNFSFGINSIVHSLKGDEKVLLYRHDYPSLLEPFKINNFDIRWIDSADGFAIDAEELKQIVQSEKIDILAVSHVQWLSGFKLDIEAIGKMCKEADVLFIVDATQSMGAVKLDMAILKANVVIGSNYKWMNAGFGTGVMYMADSFLGKYMPTTAGFNSFTMQQNGKFEYTPSIHSYEPGHLNIHGLLVLESAILKKQEYGIDNIEQHNLRLTQQLLEGISELPVRLLGGNNMHNRSSIVLLRDTDGLFEHLLKGGFVVSKREGYVRISMHFYNAATEVAAVAEHIAAFYK